MGEAFVVEYPERNSYGEVMKGYFSLMRGFGLEFANRCDRLLAPKRGPRWFDDYVAERNEEDPTRVRRRQSPSDPSFFLKELIYTEWSPYREVVLDSQDLRVLSKKIIDTRNTWLHFSDEPSVVQLRDAADLIRGFGVKSAMKVEGPAARMIKRIDRIRNGQYPPQPPAQKDSEAPSAAADSGEPPADDIPLEPVAEEPRPPIGSLWRGPIPERRVRVTKTRDVVDVATGASLRDEIAGDLAEKVRQWTSARPLGDLWVDIDGAVGGFVEGQERLLGYTGEDPEGETARGFLIRRFYDLRDGRVVDIDTGASLTATVPESGIDEAREIEAAAAEAMEPGGTIRITNYGDVLYIDEAGMSRIAVAAPKAWFPGHLG